ncbi:peptide ABC transporter substrate-binding protein [Paracoccus sp. Z118]|uniref:peptide ABC transporter substrate-binding protein n=1 Tax=Paracoccus sp. Z118 TaxID=2851017 RepID=UPI001C2BB884|nr:peptide ABC transporter substrate-binding protein [Paracoccus sp. Z118]MBV0890818.1 peptide ABC transporter substrate-binding protein [Paracoccus sp. Z118]
MIRPTRTSSVPIRPFRAALRAGALCAAALLHATQAGALVAPVPAGVAGSPAADQSLTVWMRDPIRTLDPQRSGDAVSDQAIRLLFEGLYRPGPDGAPRPGAALRHETSADGLTWTFHLRPDAVWSDGTPVTAGDFVTAFRRLADPVLGSDGAWFTQAMGLRGADQVVRGAAPVTDLGVEAVDESTLRLHLTAPAPWLDKAVMRIWTFPVPAAKLQQAAVDGADWAAPERIVGNGPFVLTSRDSDSAPARAGFAPSPDWHGAASVRLQGIALETGGEPARALSRFDAGEVDLMAVPGPLFADWSEGRKDAASALPRGCTNALIVNLADPAPGALATEPLQNPAIRRALSLAIDREAIAAALGGGQTPADGWVPPSLAGFTASEAPDAPLDQRRAEAQALLTAAGITPDSPLRLTLRYNSSPQHEATGRQIRADWKPLGVELKLVHAPWADHADVLKAGDFQLARFGWCADVNDAAGFLRYFRPDGANPGSFAHAEYDRLTAEAASAADPAPLQTRADAILRDELPLIPLYHYAAPMLVAPDLRGLARGDAMGGWSGQDIWRAE